MYLLYSIFVYSLLSQELNYDQSFHLEFRGNVPMKGKPEPMKCWFLSRAVGGSMSVTTPTVEESPLA